MTEKNISTQIPVIFQKLEEFEKEDSRFIKVKIWLLHTGLNFNGSSFSKEAVDKAIPTLANTPILSFIEETSDGTKDFSDHRMELHRSEDGDYSFKYLGSAVGVIPETNNAHWEMRVTDSGEEKEYLVVEALMWTKWDDPTEIMTTKGTTPHSMELADDYSGSYDNKGVFHFETFKFWGACLLGEGVQPAMQNSTAELQFTENAKETQKTIENKLQEFYTLFSQQGGTGMEDNQPKTEETPEVETINLAVSEDGSVLLGSEDAGINISTPAIIEATSEVASATFSEDGLTISGGTIEIQEAPVAEVFETTEVTPEVETEVKEEIQPTQEFALTANQLRDQLRAELGKETYKDSWGDEYRKYYLIDNTDALVIFENTQENYQLYAAPFTLNGDNVELNLADAYKVKVEYVAFEGNQELFTINSERFSVEQAAIQSELEVLKSYKRTREEDDIKAKFADKLSEQEFTEVFEKMKESAIEDVEDKLFALYGKKNFSISKPAPQVNKVSFSLPKDEDLTPNPYGDIFED